MRNTILGLMASGVLLCATGCSTWEKLNPTEQGAVVGAGSGAVLGGAATGSASGAAVGGALGGVVGGVIGHERDDD